ncbi:MAG: DUF3120 domain-containing protein [Cyanobacteriota bacterium]|nr:DUF3120 domain-containing protein [Cyanobacteriota bacterium]
MIGVPTTPLAPRLAPRAQAQVQATAWRALRGARDGVAGSLLVTLPVFLQAPWVRLSPVSATLFTAVLVACGVLLERQRHPRLRDAGSLLVGFAGSWLAGSLFWGWCRLHPIWHLPIEAFALPLALAGLSGRWRLGCALYLGSLVGTAATDAAIAATGVMPLWPLVLAADPLAAGPLLQDAAQRVLEPGSLLLVAAAAGLLLQACLWMWPRGRAARVASAALATTLAIDGVFLAAALAAPRLSGLI